jgi:hypothetical protein
MSNVFYRAIAQQRWPGVEISSAGRFALCTRDASGTVKAVYLLADAETASRAALGVNHPLVVDLQKPESCPLPTRCKDIGYSDREERRKYGE